MESTPALQAESKESSDHGWAGTAAETWVQFEWEPGGAGGDPTPPGTGPHRENIHIPQYALLLGESPGIPVAAHAGRESIEE